MSGRRDINSSSSSASNRPRLDEPRNPNGQFNAATIPPTQPRRLPSAILDHDYAASRPQPEQQGVDTDDDIDDSIFDVDGTAEPPLPSLSPSTPIPANNTNVPTLAGIVAYLFRPAQLRVLPARRLSDPPAEPLPQLRAVPWQNLPFLPNHREFYEEQLVQRIHAVSVKPPAPRGGRRGSAAAEQQQQQPVVPTWLERLSEAGERRTAAPPAEVPPGRAARRLTLDMEAPAAQQRPQQPMLQHEQQQQQQQHEPQSDQGDITNGDNNNELALMAGLLIDDPHEMRLPGAAPPGLGAGAGTTGPTRVHRKSYQNLKRPPQPHMCIRERTADGEELFINVMSWSRIMMPASPEDPIPLYGGMKVSPMRRGGIAGGTQGGDKAQRWYEENSQLMHISNVFDGGDDNATVTTTTLKSTAAAAAARRFAKKVPRCNQRSPPNVYAVMVNPEILKHVGRTCPDPDVSRYVEKTALVQLMSDFVEAMNPGLELSRRAEILVDRDLAGELKDIWNAVQAKRERDKETIQLGGVPTYSQAIANAAQRLHQHEQSLSASPTGSAPASQYPTVSSVPIATPAGPAAPLNPEKSSEPLTASTTADVATTNALNNNAGATATAAAAAAATTTDNRKTAAAPVDATKDECDSLPKAASPKASASASSSPTTTSAPKTAATSSGSGSKPSSPQTATKKERLGGFLPKICSNRIPFISKKEKKTVAPAAPEAPAPVDEVSPVRLPAAAATAADSSTIAAPTTAASPTITPTESAESRVAATAPGTKGDDDLEKVNK